MEREKLESKLKALAHRNKKLLQSISTHLISNPDELETRLHEHRFLEQNRDSVEKYEKIQAALAVKEHEISRMHEVIARMKQEYAAKLESMDREHRRKLHREDDELDGCRHEIKMLRKELAENKDKFNSQKQAMEREVEMQKQANLDKQQEIASLNQKMKEMREKMQQMGKQLEQKQRVKKFQALEEVQQSLANFRNQRT